MYSKVWSTSLQLEPNIDNGLLRTRGRMDRQGCDSDDWNKFSHLSSQYDTYVSITELLTFLMLKLVSPGGYWWIDGAVEPS